MSEQRLFAGFWRDGAVVVPSEKHYVNDRCVFAVHKKDGALDLCTETYEYWHKVFWLDTTTPTELTPQEVLDLYRVVFPSAEQIMKTGSSFCIKLGRSEVPINWGSLIEYPSQKKWRVPTDADKGKTCQYWDNGEQPYTTGTFITEVHGRYLVFDGDDYLPWDNCKVLED